MDEAGRRPFAKLLLPRHLYEMMLSHARQELRNECCGLLAGNIVDDIGRATQHFAIRNDLASPLEYSTNPRDLLDAMKSMRAAGTEPLAIYHSHPTSRPVPSRTDIARNYWGETAVHLIIGLAEAEPEVRGWWIWETGYEEAAWSLDL
jgi:proteasome lid subunit RPN8/RPN11